MILAMALALLAPSEVPSTALARDAAEPVRIWISNKGVFGSGDAVRVQIETGRAGHLLVLQLDPSGKVRVLFPVDPSDDAFVQANRRYEIRQPGEAASFTAADGGVGLVYAAIAEDPFRLDALVTPEGTWSAGALAIARESQDPEAELTAIVQRVVSDRGFDYDVLDYQVAGRIASQVTAPAWWSPAYGEVHDDCWGCGGWANDGLYVSVGFGFGWGWPYYYNPWYWGYGYYPGYYPPYWGGGYYPPYYPGYYPPYYGGGYYPSGYIKGRPRGYTVEPYGGEPRPHDGAGNAAKGGTTSGAPARRARPPVRGYDGGSTVEPNSGGSSGGKQPSAGGQSGSGKSGGSGSGGRARPRSGRPASESRVATEPWVERERPAAGGQGWIRIDDATVPAQQDTRLVSGGQGEAGRVTGRARATYSGIGGSRALPEARRVTTPSGRSFSYSSPGRSRGSDPRQSAAAAQGGPRSGSGSRPSVGTQHSGGGSGARPAPSGGSRSGGGASRPSGGGGGGRSRGRP